MIQKRTNGHWRVQVKSRGAVVADKTFEFKRDATLWETQQKRLLTLGEFVDPSSGKIAVSELVERWMSAREHAISGKTFSSEGYALKSHLPAKLNNRPIASVQPSDLDALFASMLGKPLARPTVVRFRNTLSSMFGWAAREKLIQKNPVIESKVPKGKGLDKKAEIYPFSLEELREVTAALIEAHPQQGPVVSVLALTGLRWGELVALRVRDVQMIPYPAFRVSRSASDGQPIRTVTKGGSTRTVPLPDAVMEVVQPLLVDRQPDELLFLSPTGNRLNGPNWKRSVRWAANARGRRTHDLRHTAATLWLLNGVDLKTVQTWLGHSTATLTADTYAHWAGTDSDKASVARMNAILGHPTGTRTSTRERIAKP